MSPRLPGSVFPSHPFWKTSLDLLVFSPSTPAQEPESLDCLPPHRSCSVGQIRICTSWLPRSLRVVTTDSEYSLMMASPL